MRKEMSQGYGMAQLYLPSAGAFISITAALMSGYVLSLNEQRRKEIGKKIADNERKFTLTHEYDSKAHFVKL